MSLSLDQQLKTPKHSLDEFFQTANNVLTYIKLITTDSKYSGDYRISKQKLEGTEKYLRPINIKLYIDNPVEFEIKFKELIVILAKIKDKILPISEEDRFIIDSVLYTIQQSLGVGFDLLVGSNSSRKHVGNRFEELIRVVFSEIGIPNKKTVLQIPYHSDEGKKVFKCENDLILSKVLTPINSKSKLEISDIVVSVKTTSKDRMGKIFIDKLLLQQFLGHPQKVLGIFLNDVQRKESGDISFTLVSGLFMVYTEFLTPLEGVYYLDPPPNAYKKPFSNYMKRFSDLISEDIFELLAS